MPEHLRNLTDLQYSLEGPTNTQYMSCRTTMGRTAHRDKTSVPVRFQALACGADVHTKSQHVGHWSKSRLLDVRPAHRIDNLA